MPTTGRSPYVVTDATPYGLPNPRLVPPAGLPDDEQKAFSDLVTAPVTKATRSLENHSVV
jgi:hypothetical protein